MKNTIKILPLFLLATIALFSFATWNGSGIKGTVSPAESAGIVWAITGTDSVKVESVEGAFQFADIKPGTYKLVVEAKAPYKNFEKDNITVAEGDVVDLGTISLEQ